jgi:hypothetical protein
MSGDKSRYLAFLVRMWQPGDEGKPVWRASVDNPHTAERHYFADLEALFAFLEEQTASLSASSEAIAATIQAETIPAAR